MKKLLVLLLLLLLLGLSLCWAQVEDFVKEVPSGAQVWHQEEHKVEREKLEKRLKKIEAEINKLKKAKKNKLITKENKEILDNIERKLK